MAYTDLEIDDALRKVYANFFIFPPAFSLMVNFIRRQADNIYRSIFMVTKGRNRGRGITFVKE